MKRLSIGIMILPLFVLMMFIKPAFAGCWVEDGTFYSKSKYDMITFAIAMDQGKKQKALQMVNEGRIHSCSQASCIVLEREKGVVKVNILGVGPVWIYKTFLNCR